MQDNATEPNVTESITSLSSKTKQLRYQYSLRMLMILITIIGLACAGLKWYIDQQRAMVEREQQAVIAIKKLGGIVDFDKTVHVLHHLPGWLRTIAGDEEYAPVTFVDFWAMQITDAELEHVNKQKWLKVLDISNNKITDAGLAKLGELITLEEFSLGGTQITDAGLIHLSELKSLTKLDLQCTSITNSGLEKLRVFTKLQELNLSGTQVTDAGLVHLSGLTALKWLKLTSTEITDTGLEQLHGLKAMQELDLSGGTKITQAGYDRLKTALPTCNILLW